MNFFHRLYFLPPALLSSLLRIIPSFRLRSLLLSKIFKDSSVGVLSTIHSPITFTKCANLIIGNNTTINSNCILDTRNQIIVGDNCMIGSYSSIYTLGHNPDSVLFASEGGPVIIKNNVIIFPHSILMPNIIIEEGAVVYPGSVVTKCIPANHIVGGNPAKFIRLRREVHQTSLRYPYYYVV